MQPQIVPAPLSAIVYPLSMGEGQAVDTGSLSPMTLRHGSQRKNHTLNLLMMGGSMSFDEEIKAGREWSEGVQVGLQEVLEVERGMRRVLHSQVMVKPHQRPPETLVSSRLWTAGCSETLKQQAETSTQFSLSRIAKWTACGQTWIKCKEYMPAKRHKRARPLFPNLGAQLRLHPVQRIKATAGNESSRCTRG